MTASIARGRALPRGIRNHNPGNLRRSADPWQGLAAEQSDAEFFQFASAKWGIRALARTLIAYQDRVGLKTIKQMIGRWAPPNENDTGAYVRAVGASVDEGHVAGGGRGLAAFAQGFTDDFDGRHRHRTRRAARWRRRFRHGANLRGIGARSPGAIRLLRVDRAVVLNSDPARGDGLSNRHVGDAAMARIGPPRQTHGLRSQTKIMSD